MFLKSVEIFGFKSFADRCHIDFSDGISALLGPNGCGKSNVVDSIKWVLGEQSTKTLRAEKMEDVIFNGTETRKALNVAEVTLTISNDTGLLPIDMPEIEIKRRLYRSGESEYYINNTPVKLRELKEVFFDTGVGKSAYSIMEQGKIDQVLSNKPEERRYIFEEAAGITKYKAKGAEAERKLEKTEENVRQVESILSEVKRSYDTLKKQSDKTVLYRTYKDEVFSLELNIQLLRLKGFIEEQQQKEILLKERQKERDEIKHSIDELNEALEENLDQVNSMEAKLIETQKRLYGIDLEKSNIDNQKAILSERSSELQRHIAQAQQRDEALQEKCTALKASVKEKEDTLEEHKLRIKEISENISSFEGMIKTADRRIEANEEAIDATQKQEKELHAAENDRQDALRSITDDIVRELDKGLKETGYSSKRKEEQESQLKEKLEALRILLQGKASLFGDATKLKSLGDKEKEQMLHSGVALADDIRSRIDEISSSFETYRKLIPNFIDDFLAPEGIITKKREIDADIENIRKEIREARTRIEQLREENKNLAKKIDEYRSTLEELRMNLVRMNTQKANIEDSLAQTRKEIAEQELLIEENLRDIKQTQERFGEIAEKLSVLDKKREEVASKEKDLKKELATLESGITERNKNLMTKEKQLKGKMESLGKIQGAVEKLQIEVTTVSTEIRNLYENFRENHSHDLSEFEDRMFEIRTPSKDLRDSLNSVKSKLKDLGSVNLMAPEEFSEVKERYEFLQTQLDDLQKAKEDLTTITNQIRTESSELFLRTYEQIKKNFHAMFRRLFGGGRAELRLTDPDTILTSGIEIYAQPPGKKLENIALLSGGERSLTGVGLLFATYMVRPSPFCILDEIDAALDEQNVGRFVHLLMEFGNTSQFIVITHNKKTVTGARTLLGVTMEESGVSKAVAIRLENSSQNKDAQPERLDDAEESEDVNTEETASVQLSTDNAEPAKAGGAEEADAGN